MLRLFGVRRVRIGAPVPAATLFVANDVSWVDIVTLHSQRMMGFVAKREIAGWPLVGWLATRGETIFHQRGSTESLGGVLQVMLARLRSGHSVGVFPEGRTGHGDAVRSEEHTSELQSLMRISYAVFCLQKKKTKKKNTRLAI